MSREKKLFKNTVILSLGVFLPQLANLAILPIYTLYLGKDEFGLYDLINLTTYILAVVVTFQIHQAAFRYLIEEKEHEGKSIIITNVIIFVLPLSTLSCFVSFFILPSDIDLLTKLLMVAFIYLNIINATIGQITRGLGMAKVYAISTVLRSFCILLFVIVLMHYLSLRFLGMYISLNLAIILALIYQCQKIRLFSLINVKKFSREVIKNLLNYSWPMVPNTVSIWIVTSLNRFLITGYLGIEMTAVFAIAYKIPAIFNSAYGAFNMAWQESASLSNSDSDVNEYYSTIFERLYSFLIGCMGGLISATPIIFKVLINGDYAEAYYQMPILFIAMLFSSLSSYYGSIYIALKRTKSVGVSSSIAALISAIISITLLKKIGLYAASLSMMVSYMVLMIYRGIDTRKYRKISYNKAKITIGLVLIIIMSVLCYINTLYLNIANIILGVTVFAYFNKEILLLGYRTMLRTKLNILKSNNIQDDLE